MKDKELMVEWNKKLSEKSNTETEYTKEPICLECVVRDYCPLAPTQKCSLFIPRKRDNAKGG